MFNWRRRTASLTKLLLFNKVCNSSYGSSIDSSFLLLFCLSQAGSLQDRHGMWYGDGLELRFECDGRAFSRRFSLISWTNSSTAKTSLACLLGMVVNFSPFSCWLSIFIDFFTKRFVWGICILNRVSVYCRLNQQNNLNKMLNNGLFSSR